MEDALSACEDGGQRWLTVLSLQAPPEFVSVSSRGCEWSVKRHRHGSRRKPPLTLFSTASLGKQSDGRPRY